jgi:signal transduction histidine kinase
MACRETLNNVVKHAAAKEVSVRIQFRDGTLSVTIADNGRGLPVSESPRAANTPGTGRNGLSNLRRRLENVGGKFEMDSRPETGTTVTLSVDLRHANLIAKAGLDAARNGTSDSSAHCWLAPKSGAVSWA